MNAPLDHSNSMSSPQVMGQYRRRQPRKARASRHAQAPPRIYRMATKGPALGASRMRTEDMQRLWHDAGCPCDH
jgi:hypothetical protein